MSSYAVGILKDVQMGAPIVEYLEQIDATLAPFGGRYAVHGGDPELLEGESQGDLIMIEFDNRAVAREWYESAAYQAIVPLRAENSRGTIMFVDGVDPDHRATDILAA